ncbi:Septin and tuftelin-interacting protein 1-like protein 1 [Dichanthelium oligosanthes]|uniref:Septin and tuftelin-interacting protein 1-like protein 1 n=1 Tax=Dichanthelium oligosanthes TaxID=888268 RepID=A0A1E5VX92_9POAL|nr:Septin and tuftelin-interacting protein 1-like protein 1 [Dichanthelium oligosanthes]
MDDGCERARRTRHDAIYGVFAESDSDYDSDGDGPRRRKRRRGGSEADLSKPVRFVSTGNVMPPSQEPEPCPMNAAAKEDEAEAEADDNEPLPAMFGKISEGARARREEKERERAAAARRRQESGTPPPAQGSVQFNDTVANIMRMMGWKSGMGLGKDGRGRSEPLAAPTLRPKNAGLGYVERFKKPMPESANLPPATPPPASTKERQQRWSKKASGRKAPVLTKNALVAMRAEEEQAGQYTVVQKVIDKRGPQERVLTDLRGLNDQQEMEANDVPMPELQYNARLLVDDAKADVLRLNGQLRREQEKTASLAREKEKLSKQEVLQKRQLQVMETIAGALAQVRADDAAGVLTLEGLFLTFQDLKARFEVEFKMCGMAWITCQFAHPLLVRFFQGWQPLQDPSVGLEVMSSWKDLLEGDQPYDFSHGAASMAPYAQLVSEVILPPVRISGTNSWDARVPEPMLDFLKTWDQVLPPVVLRFILEHVVIPKLSAGVDSWDPRREKMPIHMALQEFQINPADQKLDQFKWVMLWACTIPAHHMVHMLEVDFFRKWHQVLFRWLCSPNPDFNEIVNWYKGWKDLFPPELLSNERIRMLLALGLDMMNRAAEGLEVMEPGTTDPLDPAQKESRFPSRHMVPGAATTDLSFKECIQAYAMEKGLLFMPRVGKFYSGMPVYKFGTVSICLDSVERLVYAQLGGMERWSRVSLRQVVEMN